jgi:hypothetical protein
VTRWLARAVVALVVLALPATAAAAEWGAITPGRTTQEAVRAQYGEPSQRATQKVEGYDTVEWVYEGPRAPRGFRRMAIEFGMLTPAGFRPEIVRVMRLQPNPGVFTRPLIERGWGRPDRAGKDKDVPVYYYDEGLLVLFDKEGWVAVGLIFTPPQPTASP